MWHGLQDPISPILHMEKMKEELEKIIFHINLSRCQNLDILLDKKRT